MMPIHFIWFGPRALGYAELLAVKTATRVYGVKPRLWVDDATPENVWLERMRQYTEHERIPVEWLEVAYTTRLYPHRVDYLRYQLLYDFGGLCLDMDTLCVKSLFDLSLDSLVVSQEPAPNPNRSPNLNGAIMYAAQKHHLFVTELLERSIDILKSQVILRWPDLGPGLIRKVLGGKAGYMKLPPECCHPYSFTEWSKIFVDNPIDERMYVLHYWGKKAWKFVRRTVTPAYVKTSDSLYAKVVKEVLGNAIY